MRNCRVCDGVLEEVLDLGSQPVSNRYLRAPGGPSPAYRLRVAVCLECGLVQLTDPPPADLLRPELDWLAYNEPQAHLDEVAAAIAALPGIGPESRAIGLGDHDGPLLERLRAAGLGECLALDWRGELAVSEPAAGTETLQERLRPAAAAEIAARHGRADVVVARSLVEHGHEPRELLGALLELVADGGYLVIEAPESTPMLEHHDPSALWEDHVLYFTPATAARTLQSAGLEVVNTIRSGTADELVIIARAGGPAGEVPITAEVAEEVRRARAFGPGVESARERWTDLLDRERDGGIALFGAGHAAAVFVNGLGLGDRVDVVIDGHERKQGLHMPGGFAPIAGPEALGEVALCLLAINRESEQRVADASETWAAGGGRFVSISPASSYWPFAEVTT